MNQGTPVDLRREIPELIRGRLRARDDLRETDWLFWEKRNLNLHRVVALCTYAPSSASELETRVRDTLGRHFRCAWWRGLGFGAVLEVRDIAGFPEEFAPLVDGRANPKGTWQWLVLVSRQGRAACGLHTWVAGFLSPVYQELLIRLALHGYEVSRARKEKDGVMRLLTAASSRRIPEFEG